MKKSIAYDGDYSLSYAEQGDRRGYPILIQHGLIASIEDWDLFERLIRLGTRLISIARPGYGESSPYVMNNMAEWAGLVSVLVGELGLSQFDVLGVSSGAPYSYALGYGFPDKVRNIFIFSGIPALYDEEVVSHWPFPMPKNASVSEMQKLARELFFSNAPAEDMERPDIRDSMANDCFGIAQDLRIRGMDWGFRLSDVRQNVTMSHSRSDNYATALLTARMLPNCRLITRESGEHFSKELLDDFIRTAMAEKFES